MTHTIMIPENDLRRIIAKHFANCKPENVWFGIKERQMDKIIVYATISVEEEI